MPRNYPVPSAGPVDSTSGAQRDGVIFSSAARAVATYNSPEYVNPGAEGLRIFVNATISGGGTLDLKVQNFDPASQTWMDVPGASATQITATGTAVITLFPGNTGDLEADDNNIATPLGMRWRISVTIGTATTTFSVGADYLSR